MVVLQASGGRLYPSSNARRATARIGGQCRALWNYFLAANRDRYGAENKFAVLPARRKEERFAGLPHRAAQMTGQKLDRALRDCAKAATARKGFPRFKRHGDRNDSFQFVGSEIRVLPGKIRLPAIGWVRIRGLRAPDGARLVQATIHQCPGNETIAARAA